MSTRIDLIPLVSLPHGSSSPVSLIPTDCRLVSIDKLTQARELSGCKRATPSVVGGAAVCWRVETVEEHITTAKHLVTNNRIRLLLRELEEGTIVSKIVTRAMFLGLYSDMLIEHNVRSGDMLITVNNHIQRLTLKPKEPCPPDLSVWTLVCPRAGQDPDPRVVLARYSTPLLTEKELLDIMEVDEDSIDTDEGTNKIIMSPSAQIRRLSPAKPPLGPPQTVCRPRYKRLIDCSVNKAKYNVFGVVDVVVQLPTRVKSGKLVVKLVLTDESLVIEGDLVGGFRFDILADSIEQLPSYVSGTVYRIHHMQVQHWNGIPDGRVYSPLCITTVDPGDLSEPCSLKENFSWDDEDQSRVVELEKWWARARRPQLDNVMTRTINEIVGESVSRMFCRLLAVFYSEDGGLVLRVEDGTMSPVLSVEFRGVDTQTEDCGDGKHFLDVWLDSENIMREKHCRPGAGDLVLVDRLMCVVEVEKGEESEVVDNLYRFKVKDGKVDYLSDQDDVSRLKDRLEEDTTVSEFEDRILQLVDLDQTFEHPGGPKVKDTGWRVKPLLAMEEVEKGGQCITEGTVIEWGPKQGNDNSKVGDNSIDVISSRNGNHTEKEDSHKIVSSSFQKDSCEDGMKNPHESLESHGANSQIRESESQSVRESLKKISGKSVANNFDDIEKEYPSADIAIITKTVVQTSTLTNLSSYHVDNLTTPQINAVSHPSIPLVQVTLLPSLPPHDHHDSSIVTIPSINENLHSSLPLGQGTPPKTPTSHKVVPILPPNTPVGLITPMSINSTPSLSNAPTSPCGKFSQSQMWSQMSPFLIQGSPIRNQGSPIRVTSYQLQSENQPVELQTRIDSIQSGASFESQYYTPPGSPEKKNNALDVIIERLETSTESLDVSFMNSEGPVSNITIYDKTDIEKTDQSCLLTKTSKEGDNEIHISPEGDKSKLPDPSDQISEVVAMEVDKSFTEDSSDKNTVFEPDDDLGRFRKSLTAHCDAPFTMKRLTTVTALTEAPSGYYKLLSTIVRVMKSKEGRMVNMVFVCSRCDKISTLTSELTCCSQDQTVQRIIKVVLVVVDEDRNETQLVATGKEAETLIGVTADYWQDFGGKVSPVEKRLENVTGGVGDFGILKDDDGGYHIINTTLDY